MMSAAEKARRAAKSAANATGKDTAVAAPAVAEAPLKNSAPPKAVDMTDSLGGKKVTAPTVHEKKASVGDRTVVVVCKMPRGLYLQLNEFVPMDVKVLGGGIEKRKQPMRVGPQIRIKPAVLPYGAIPNYPIVNGFSLTRDVDANFWNQYFQQNRGLELITSGLLCAFANEQDATAYCKEYGALKSGLEPIAQKDDPRVESSNNPNLSDIDIDTDTPRPKA